MAYATTNPPVCRIPRLGAHSAVWIYKSADAHTDVDAAGYFTNGDALGIKEDDVMIVIDTATPTCTIHQVASTVAGGASTITAATLA